MVWRAHYWKPVQAGLTPQTDSEVLSSFIGQKNICPSAYVLKKPASPNQAAKKEFKTLYKKNMLSNNFFKKQKLPLPLRLVIEGAGGLLVPINNQKKIIDLIQAEKAPVIITARSGLGTLNHTFLTLAALRAAKIPILGVVMCGPLHKDNKKDIEHIGRVKVLLELPILKTLSAPVLKKYFKKLKPLLP